MDVLRAVRCPSGRCRVALAACALAIACAPGLAAGAADVSHWIPVRPGGQQPPPLQWAAGAYDPDGRRLLMFAGTDQVDDQRDVWALKLAVGDESWSRLRPTGNAPSARQHAAATIVPSHRRFVTFGGFSTVLSDALGETWILDLAVGTDGKWIKVTGPGPEKRRAATLVHQLADGPAGPVDRVILFGGYSGTRRFNDVWAFDAAPGAERWTELAPAGPRPSARDGHVAAYDAAGNRMIVYGGTNRDRQPTSLAETWALDLAPGAERWTKLEPDGSRVPAYTWSSGVVDPCPGAERLLVFGGYSITADRSSSDTWALALAPAGDESWAVLETTGARPVPRDSNVAAYDPVGHRMVIYGGWDGPGKLQRDTWALDLLPCGSAPPSTPPPATEQPTPSPTGQRTDEPTPTDAATPTDEATAPPTATATAERSPTPDYVQTIIAGTLTAVAQTPAPPETPDPVATAVAATLTARLPTAVVTATPTRTPDALRTAIAGTLTALAPPPSHRLFIPAAERP